MLDLYLRFVDNSSYCVLSLRDTEENRRTMDREARFYMSKPRVLSAEMKILDSGRQAGYLKNRGMP